MSAVVRSPDQDRPLEVERSLGAHLAAKLGDPAFLVARRRECELERVIGQQPGERCTGRVELIPPAIDEFGVELHARAAPIAGVDVDFGRRACDRDRAVRELPAAAPCRAVADAQRAARRALRDEFAAHVPHDDGQRTQVDVPGQVEGLRADAPLHFGMRLAVGEPHVAQLVFTVAMCDFAAPGQRPAEQRPRTATSSCAVHGAAALNPVPAIEPFALMRPSTPGRTSLIRSERASMSKRQGCAPVHLRSPEPWICPPSAAPSKRSSASPSRSIVASAEKLTGGIAAPRSSARAENRYGSAPSSWYSPSTLAMTGSESSQRPAQVLPFAAERQDRQRAFRRVCGRQGDGAARRDFQAGTRQPRAEIPYSHAALLESSRALQPYLLIRQRRRRQRAVQAERSRAGGERDRAGQLGEAAGRYPRRPVDVDEMERALRARLSVRSSSVPLKLIRVGASRNTSTPRRSRLPDVFTRNR